MNNIMKTNCQLLGFNNQYLTQEYSAYKFNMGNIPIPHIESLLQLRQITTDGDLISPQGNQYWYNMGMVSSHEGFHVINEKGIKYLLEIGAIEDY